MNMGMSLSMGQTMDLRLEQRQEQRMAMLEEMALALEQLMEDGEARGERYDRMLGALERALPPSEAAIVIPSLRTSVLKNKLLKRTVAMSTSPATSRLRTFAAESIYEEAELMGGFSIVDPATDKTQDMETTKGKLLDAVSRPAEVQQEIDARIDEIRAAHERSEDSRGAQQDMREMQAALTIAGAIEPNVRAITNLLVRSYRAGDQENGEIFREFFRDSVIFDKLLFLVSDRIQRRFAASFGTVSRSSTPKQYEEAMLNTIGEYVLVSMGIIAPDVFVLQHGEVDDVAADYAREGLQECGLNLEKLTQEYRLKQKTLFCWNRYALREVPANKRNDASIRDFIVETLRTERGDLLSSIAFDEIFATIKEIATDRKTRTPEERKEDLRQVAVDILRSDRMKQALLPLIKKNWYGALADFLRDR